LVVDRWRNASSTSGAEANQVTPFAEAVTLPTGPNMEVATASTGAEERNLRLREPTAVPVSEPRRREQRAAPPAMGSANPGSALRDRRQQR
jgi:hypothetical protein